MSESKADELLSGLQEVTFEGCGYCLIAPEDRDALRAEVSRLTAELEAARKDAQRYRFIKRRGMPKPTRDAEGSRLWYCDREADNVEITRHSFEECIDAAREPATGSVKEGA